MSVPPSSGAPLPPPGPHGQATPAPQGQPAPAPQGQPAPAPSPWGQAAPGPYGPAGPAPLPPGVPPTGPLGQYPQEAYFAPGWTAPPTQPRSRRGARIAAVCAIAGAVVVAVAGVTTAFVYWRDTRPLGEVTSPTSATSRQVRAGHCLAELPDDGTLGRVRVVPCDDAHEAEVVGALRLDDGPFPGAQAVERAAAWCEMDRAQTEQGLVPVVWTPTERSWNQGDRIVLCLAATPG